MTGRVEGKVAFITGAARGQGRAHAVRLAQEGADVIAVDIGSGVVQSSAYALGTADELAQTGRLVQATGRHAVTAAADVRDAEALSAALAAGVERFGRLDIVVANAGISTHGRADTLSEQMWEDMIDINLTGVWRTAKAAIPHLEAGGRGGSIALISSGVGLRAVENQAHYVSAKTGLLGLARALALELAPSRIRVNSIHPTAVDTPMIQNESIYRLFCPGQSNPSRDDTRPGFQAINALPIPWVDAEDVANAVLFLASDEARYITGAALPVDAGFSVK